MNKLKIILIILFFLIIPMYFCSAALLDGFACTDKAGSNCTLDDFIRIAVNGSNILLGFVGSLALLAFIVGGVIFLTSGGNAEQVTKGKQIILGAVIGLVIVFASYAIIQFVFTALNIPDTGSGGWATSNWFNK